VEDILMSLNYTHLLIPLSPEYRPDAGAIAKFMQDIIDGNYIAASTKIAFAKVVKGTPSVRQVPNPFTGKTLSLKMPSRRRDRPQQLGDVTQITGLATDQPEYDVWVECVGAPRNPPLDIGHVENDAWKKMDDPYHLEIRCRVRARIVRLFRLQSEEQLHRPPASANMELIFDEDCDLNEHDGLFVHPELGAIRIPNAGCGTFWIEFNYGKFIFPRVKDKSVNLMQESIVNLAKTTFGTEFVQACNWG
jgi:hypothetical protein